MGSKNISCGADTPCNGGGWGSKAWVRFVYIKCAGAIRMGGKSQEGLQKLACGANLPPCRGLGWDGKNKGAFFRPRIR